MRRVGTTTEGEAIVVMSESEIERFYKTSNALPNNLFVALCYPAARRVSGYLSSKNQDPQRELGGYRDFQKGG